LVTILLL